MNMLQTNADQFNEQGFTVVRDFLTGDEVSELRSICDQYLLHDHDAETEIPAGDLLQIDGFSEVLFSDRMKAAITGILSADFGFYPNFVVRLNRYTVWHIDNGFMSSFHEQADHLASPGFRHAQCIIYLQDNNADTGGGLDVRVGSHRYYDDGKACDLMQLIQDYPDEVSIDSRAGDLIMIDGRMMHRGTPADQTPHDPKYGLFFSVSNQSEIQSARFLGYLEQRAAYLRQAWAMQDSPEMAFMLKRYDDVRDIRFPESFRTKDVEFLSSHDITIFCAD